MQQPMAEPYSDLEVVPPSQAPPALRVSQGPQIHDYYSAAYQATTEKAIPPPQVTEVPPAAPRSKRRVWIILAIVLIAIIAVAVGAGVGATRKKGKSGSGVSQNLPINEPDTSDTYTAVYKTSDGIGGYDLKSTGDAAFAFDYDSSGLLDHVAFYRPGTGTMWILKHDGTSFTPVYAQGAPGDGIGGYDLLGSNDGAFAFDYDHSGKLDHMVLYRPGQGAAFILKNENGNFTPVYQQGAPGSGIGGYDLLGGTDRAFAFDYDHSGKLDHLVLYRPGSGAMFILKNDNGDFSPVYSQGAPGSGIGGYDLLGEHDRAFAFDYDHSGKLDHMVLYRPGSGAMFILKNDNGVFSPVYKEGAPGTGIGGYDLASTADLAYAYDYDHSGKLDHIVLYRPGAGAIFILKNDNGKFSPVYKQGAQGSGICGDDLGSPADASFAFDYNNTSKQDYMFFYRAGAGSVLICKHGS